MSPFVAAPVGRLGAFELTAPLEQDAKVVRGIAVAQLVAAAVGGLSILEVVTLT
jgi:hypothetical protein